MFLTDLQIVRPRFERSQEEILDWIASAHGHGKDRSFSDALREKLMSLGLGENKIQKRGYHLPDCSHTNWDKMRIYDVEKSPHGSSIEERMEVFDEAATLMLESLYPEDSPLPSHLIHTTCTGYVAPSPAQKLVSRRGNPKRTVVTHAYHMGCYGAIPSIRMAMGHCLVENEATDVVHTELCSLHMNPSLHSTEQLVVQSLFADGGIKYTIDSEKSEGFSIIALLEEIICGTENKMTWNPKSFGFHMTISRDIPVLLRRTLGSYLERLSAKAGGIDLGKVLYAIHPGGPKIIDQIADFLKLEPHQITHSRQVLREYGNMSSATLPHVWEKMWEDDEVPSGTFIVSLAFGPGLSISGALFEKRSS